MVSLLIALALGGIRLPLGLGEWLVVFGMGLMGMVDDRFDLRARWKALVSLACAGMLAWLTWPVLREAGSHLPILGWSLATKTGLAVMLLVAWFWAIPQACNLIDGMNGLALGFFLILAYSMDLPLGPNGQGAYLLGSLVTLLAFNFPHGRQFIGDAGALFLGTLFATLGVHLLATQSPNQLLWAFAYPIVDVLMVIAIRLAQRRPLGEGDRNHFHHQWQRIFPKRPILALGLTLLPAIASMQALHEETWRQVVAWCGVSWLFLSACYFLLRSLAGDEGTESSPDARIVDLMPQNQLRWASSGEIQAFVPRSSKQADPLDPSLD